MAKSYTDELAEWVKRRDASRPRQDRNVVAFLAVRHDVRTAMAAGYALKTIWEHLLETGKIAYRYETFLKHVRRHIRQEPPSPPAAGKSEPETGAIRKPQPDPLVKSAVPEVRGFAFDAKPKKEDLI
jgi:hypothetical protein